MDDEQVRFTVQTVCSRCAESSLGG
jgi:hypothetical protein